MMGLMPGWEYCEVEVAADVTSWQEVLAELGRERWELVDHRDLSSGDTCLVLKRPGEPAISEAGPMPVPQRGASGGSAAPAFRMPAGASPVGPREGNGGRRYYAVARDILSAIADGRLNEGDRLPNERRLAAMCNASRPTVRDALLALELLGVVDVRPGSGAYVAGVSPHVHDLASLRFGTPPRELIEAREQIEPGVARLCATRLNEADIADLAHLIDRCQGEAQRAPEDVPESFLDLSLQFHSELAARCGNAILAKLTQQLVDAAAHPLWMIANGMYVRTAESRAAQIAEHRRVLDALERRDAELAAACMAEHLEGLSRGVFGQRGRRDAVSAQRWRHRTVV